MSEPDAPKLALEVARASASAWRRAATPEAEDAVCFRAVAGLALLPRELDPGECTKRLLEATDEQVAGLLEDFWCGFTLARPELALRCEPLYSWLEEEPREETTVAAVTKVARAGIEAGALEVFLDRDRAIEVDVLGDLRLALRNEGERRGRGEFHTPARVSGAIGAMASGALGPAEAIRDPFAGTGSMLRGAAAALRGEGRDPHQQRWMACDIDPLAVAALAVNAHLWDLGPHVLLGCADSLAEPDWHLRAAKEQSAARERWLREVAAALLEGCDEARGP